MARRPKRPDAPSVAGGRSETRQAPRGAAAGFYAELFTAEELADLARASGEPSLDDEVALLRVAIRRGVTSGESLETIGRSVQRLAQTLKLARALRGDALRNLEEALARVLDEIGAEMGQT
jgi:hypothetical protein